jgi:predicted permease
MQSGWAVLFFERLWQDIRHAARMFKKSPSLTAVALFSLALGIGANTAIFSLVNAVFFLPLPVREPEQLVSIFTIDKNNPGDLETSHLNFVDFRDKNQVFSGIANYITIPLILNKPEQSERITGQLVSGNYFDVLGVKPIVGRTFLPDEDRTPGASPVVVVSHNFWVNRLNADSGAVGKVIKLNDYVFTVVGVAPKNFTGTDLSVVPEVWVPMMMYHEAAPGTETRYTNRRFLFLSLVGRLKPGVSLKQAQESMTILASQLAQEYPKDNEGRGVKLVPLSEARLNPDHNNLLLRISVMLMSIVGTILLIACVNVANLLLAKATSRRKEIALRLAVGASRARLITQLLTESVLLSLLGGLLGLLLAYAIKDLLRALIPPSFGVEGITVTLDRNVLLFTFVLSVLSGLIFGLFPGLQASKPDLTSTLKADILTPGHHGSAFSLRRALIIMEVSLCLVTLVVTALFVRSLNNARKIDPGFRVDNVLLLAIDISLENADDEAKAVQFYQQLVERIKNLSGVQQVVISRSRPFEKSFSRSVFIEGQEDQPNQQGVLVKTNIVGADYFKTLNIPVLSGREFANSDTANTGKVVVVNEAMAQRFWPNQNPLGKRLRLIRDTAGREVIGVVKNTKINSLKEQDQPYLYLPLSQHYTPTATIYVDTANNPTQLTAAVRNEVRNLNPNLPVFDVRTLREQADRSLGTEHGTAMLLTFFGLLALLLAAGGMFGVMSYFVSQRTRDIGIRMALGAQPWDVVKLVMGEGMLLILIGVTLGLLAALGLTHLMRTILFGISPTDPFAFISAPLILVVLALIASYIPARRASRIDPLRTLRTE